MRYAIFFAALLVATNATSQVRKCVSAQGKVTYSDSVCVESSTAVRGTNQDGERVQQPKQPSYYERELTSKIVEYLEVNDLAGAKRLAVTPDHLQMIEDRRRMLLADEDRAKAARQAARPTVCISSGSSVAAGYGSNYSGTMVCKK